MNNFATIDSSAGLMKDMYDDGKSPLEAALKKKRLKLAETKGMKAKEEEEDNAV